MQVKIKKLHKNAITPKYATAGAACFDLHAMNDASDMFALPVEFVGETTVRTGLSFEVPEDHVMLVFSRSGHGFRSNMRLANAVGVIDSDYRGEVMVKLTKDDDDSFIVEHGDRIAQAMIIPVKQVSFEEVDELGSTDRGQGGFGSTGN